MLIPNYIAISNDQLNELNGVDEDTASDLAMDWMEEENLPVTDIDKFADDLAGELDDTTAQKAVNGATELCEDPPLFLATPAEVKDMAIALTNSKVSDDVADELDTLTEFYTEAANNGHGVLVLFN